MKNKLVPFLAFLGLLAGCASSTMGPGSGAAEGVVKGSVDQVSNQTQVVFQQMNIQMTGSSIKNSGNERQISGKLGDSDISVKIDNAGSTTSVSVDASKNAFNGNSDLAKDILNRIVLQS